MAAAAPEVVRIASADLRSNATASTLDEFVRMQPRQNDALQRWALDRATPNAGTRVVNVATRGCLAVSTVVEGTPVVQRPCRNHPSEQWRLVQSSTDRTVRFVNVYSGLCMTVEPISTGRYPLLRQYRCGAMPAQQFHLVAA